MPFIRRVGRPGLLGVAARSAVAAGTATAVSGAVVRRQHERAAAAQAEQAAQFAELQAQQPPPAPVAPPPPAPPVAPPPPAPAAPAAGSDLIAQLQQLATLQQQGLLTAEEFAQAKSQLLAG